jgi:SNF2 family DNA or RNA helicase
MHPYAILNLGYFGVSMLEFKKRYVMDENSRPVAVQVDLEVFEKLERILEDYGLAKLMEENDDDYLKFEDAKTYYETLTKSQCKGYPNSRANPLRLTASVASGAAKTSSRLRAFFRR